MTSTIARWDPAQDFAHLRNTMDRLFDQRFSRLPGFRGGDELSATNLGLDIYETGVEYIVKAAIPGVDPADVDISVEDDVLTIKGESKKEEEESGETWIRRELSFGSFQRSLRLPPTVEAEKAQATFENGMLKLTLPKRPEARARSIKITPAGVIDGSASRQN
jgi:HSP20 family protein